MDYIVVQAGGKGTRLKHLTKNKPKALVPVENLPMIFHLFRNYPDKKYVIIADHKKETMRAYLSAFAEVKYQVVDAQGTGTCAGIVQAMELLPEQEPFMLIWSDLIMTKDFKLPAAYENGFQTEHDYVGISQTFSCRWSYRQGCFREEASDKFGVAGLFLFTEKKKLAKVPKSGEFVRWLQKNENLFQELVLDGIKEIGTLDEYDKLLKQKCRPFNRIVVQNDVLIKAAVDAQGEKLAERECKWYEKAKEKEVDVLPKIYSTHPLKMEYIRGKNIYEYNLNIDEKAKILKQLVLSLKRLHDSEQIPADSFSLKEAYYQKTMDRLAKIEDMIPFTREKEIVVNGRRCRNVYYYKRELEKRIEQLRCDKFAFIHGDCTFSNMMLRENRESVLLDPRGYFGYTEIFGDVRYDWAKMYYSIVGNYDRFNLGDFTLDIQDTGITLAIDSNRWEDMESYFFELTGANRHEIRLLHAVIWLSLTTYAWQDYDSVCGAFYNGIYYLEEEL